MQLPIKAKQSKRIRHSTELAGQMKHKQAGALKKKCAGFLFYHDLIIYHEKFTLKAIFLNLKD